MVILISVAALSKPHLFESRGHNRQGSDSSVDFFIPKEEPPEPEPDNKVQPVLLPEKKKWKYRWTKSNRCLTGLPVFVTVAVPY